MLKATNNTDLTSLLSGVSEKAKALPSKKATGELAAKKQVSEYTSKGQVKKFASEKEVNGVVPSKQESEFAQVLEAEGAMKEVSPKDLIAYFKQGNKAEGEVSLENAVKALEGKLESPEGKELLKSLSFDGEKFVNENGEEVKPQEILKNIESASKEIVSDSKTKSDLPLKLNNNISNQKSEAKLSEKIVSKDNPTKGLIQSIDGNKKAAIKKGISNPSAKELKKNDIASAQDFLAQRRMLKGKKVTATANGKVKLKNINPNVGQYKKESTVIDNRLIKIPKSEKSLNGKEDKVEEILKGRMSENSTPVESLAKENQTLDVATVNSQDELAQVLSMKNQGESNQLLNSAQTDVKVVDLSHIQASNKTELINQVGQYIEQSYVAGQDQIDLLVKHEELGQFRVSATRVGPGNQIDLEIQTMTQQGQQFFAENESELMKKLTQSGIKISDLKISAQTELLAFADTKSQTSDNNTGAQSQNGRGEFSQDGQQRQFSAREDQGRERRRQMWQYAQEQMLSA